MIVRMETTATLKQVTAVLAILNSYGVQASLIRNNGRSIIGLLSKPGAALDEIKDLPGIEIIEEVKHPFKLVSRQYHPENSVIKIKNAMIGGGAFCLMAGPCSIESEEQLFTSAEYCKKAGATILRGGAYKPRTSPYSFQGMGVEGLKILAQAGKQFDMPVITEILSNENIDDVVRYADILQIGTRNMQNFKLLEAVGKTGKPVMLKRGMNATLKEFLLAAEYIYAHGSSQIAICERGIRSFDTFTRNTLDLAIVPAAKELSHLPIIVDPSHATGRRDLILPLSKAAIAAGADGLMIETHPNPEKAMSDGPQSLDENEFSGVVRELREFHSILSA
jgi:3-deoxy-7-phosphoheptulonate synthase